MVQCTHERADKLRRQTESNDEQGHYDEPQLTARAIELARNEHN